MKSADIVANTINPALAQIPSWRSMPSFSRYEYVVAVSRTPMKRSLALGVRTLASIPNLSRYRVFDAVANCAFGKMNDDSCTHKEESPPETVNRIHALLRRQFSNFGNSLVERTARQLPDIITAIRYEFGHVSMYACEDGRPISLVDDACLVGFQPFYLQQRRVNGEMTFRFSAEEKAQHLMQFDKVVPGCVTDDDDAEASRITSYARFELTRDQFERVPEVVRHFVNGVDYQCWGRKQPNCARVATMEIPDRLGIDAAKKFATYMPAHTERKIGLTAKKKGSAPNEDGVVCFSRKNMVFPAVDGAYQRAELTYH